jgi:hypothetical protein
MPNATDSDQPQPPATHPPDAGATRGVAALTRLLEQGWRIEAPVLARLAWTQHTPGELTYHIILARAAQRSLVVVADTPELHHFLQQHGIPVI